MRRSSARNVLKSRVGNYFYLKTTAGGSTRALEFTYNRRDGLEIWGVGPNLRRPAFFIANGAGATHPAGVETCRHAGGRSRPTRQLHRAAALSADGNTAIVGGYGDNTFTGAVWVCTRNGKVWTQQGSKLVGNSAVGHAQQGSSIAVSADGNTAIVCGHGDNSYTGAAWVYTRSGNVWTQ